MPATAETRAVQFVDQTTEALSAALKASAKFQEDMANFWSTALGQTEVFQQVQARGRALLSQAMPTLQRTTDEYLRLWGQSYRSGIDLAKKAFENSRCDSVADCQAKAQDLWQTSVATLRANTQALTQANVHAMESWAEVMRTGLNDGLNMAATVAKAAEDRVEKTVAKAEKLVVAAR